MHRVLEVQTLALWCSGAMQRPGPSWLSVLWQAALGVLTAPPHPPPPACGAQTGQVWAWPFLGRFFHFILATALGKPGAVTVSVWQRRKSGPGETEEAAQGL